MAGVETAVLQNCCPRLSTGDLALWKKSIDLVFIVHICIVIAEVWLFGIEWVHLMQYS